MSGLPVGGLLQLLVVVAALVEDAEPAEATAAGSRPAADLAATVRAWDAPAQARVRRRLVGCDSPDVAATGDLLRTLGLVPAER